MSQIFTGSRGVECCRGPILLPLKSSSLLWKGVLGGKGEKDWGGLYLKEKVSGDTIARSSGEPTQKNKGPRGGPWPTLRGGGGGDLIRKEVKLLRGIKAFWPGKALSKGPKGWGKRRRADSSGGDKY